MKSSTLTIRTETRRPKSFSVRIDAYRFERLAANLGLFSKKFLRSLNRAETDYRKGRVREVTSLKELRKK